RAIASGHVTWPTTEKARKALRPSPAAKANGRRVTTPKRIVMTPAVRAVTAPSAAKSRVLPATSGCPDRMIGLRMTMYAIVTKVTRPPRTSVPRVEPRSLMRKKRSRADVGFFDVAVFTKAPEVEMAGAACPGVILWPAVCLETTENCLHVTRAGHSL